MAKTNFFFRMLVMVAAVAVLLTSLPALAKPGYAQTLQPSGNVVLVPPSSIKDGTPLDCVYDHVRQGVPVQLALDECNFTDSSLGTPEAGDVDSYLGGIGGSSTETTVGSVTCLNSGADPQVSTGTRPGTDLYQKYPHLDHPPASENDKSGYSSDYSYQVLKKDAEAKWKDYTDHLQKMEDVDNNGTPEQKAQYQETLLKLEKAAKDAIEKRDDWRPLISETDTENSDSGTDGSLGDYPTGDGGTAVAQTDPNAEDPCQQANQFIAECNASHWSTLPCQEFLRKLKDPNCDSMTTDPMPGEEACGGEARPDPEEVERVATLLCSMEINPSDPDQDPCAPFEMDAVVLRSDLPLKQGDPCGSLVALTTEDQCVPSGTDPKVIYMKFRERDMEEAIKKLGGPGFVIPMPQQNPPCQDCPQPETGGPTNLDSGSGEPGSGPNPDLP